jgi:hypothetical protein
VKRRGDDQKFLARVLALGVECDIALLTVDDAAFWRGLRGLEFGPLPRLQDTVAVVGYPVGGESISITAGVVSRIEVTQYSHGSNDLLGIQIDAAINGERACARVRVPVCACVCLWGRGGMRAGGCRPLACHACHPPDPPPAPAPTAPSAAPPTRARARAPAQAATAAGLCSTRAGSVWASPSKVCPAARWRTWAT